LFELSQAKKAIGSRLAELNFVYEKKIFHGPVTSLSCLDSEGKKRLVIGAGADVNVEQWGANKLTQVGFYRATMYVLDIKLFKNFFVLSDAYDSLYFLVWRESDKSLTLLAKDYDPIPVYAAGLLSRGGSLDIVCHDDRQNLQFFQYAPGDAAARGGNRLVCRADFHLGTVTTELQSFLCRSSLLVNSATPSSSLASLKQQDKFFGRSDDDQRLGVHFGTSEGGYGAVVPLSEPVYWRLTALQSVMVNALESDCSLSQRAWRLYRRSARRGGCRSNDRKKGVIDGDLVMQYTDLPLADQEDLASAIGSTVDLILDNLLELRCSIMVI
jgi:cleavage and polyadenylation specificity factor subunit 1